MKVMYVLLGAGVLLAGCQPSAEQATVEMAPDTVITTTVQPEVSYREVHEEEAVGYYVGLFENAPSPNGSYIRSNKITLAIDAMEQGTVTGHSVVAGNARPFTGTYTQEKGKFHVTAKEPGDDPYDGSFMFTIAPDQHRVEGTWKANRTHLKGSEKHYQLARKNFSYDPALTLPRSLPGKYMLDEQGLMIERQGNWIDYDEDEGAYESETEVLTSDILKINPSMQILRPEDVENMYKADLEIIRNAIYARHGYSFKNKRIRHIFDHYVEWYMPVSVDVRTKLTEMEVNNIDLIKRYEQHAHRYYDSFGR